MLRTITWEVFWRRNERISGRSIHVSSWQWMKSSCVHLWINSLPLASAAKGRRIEKISPKQRGTWAAREILLQQSPEICPELWHLISARPRVTEGPGRRKINCSPCGRKSDHRGDRAAKIPKAPHGKFPSKLLICCTSSLPWHWSDCTCRSIFRRK